MRISDWSSDVCSSDLRVYVGPSADADRVDIVHRQDLGPVADGADGAAEYLGRLAAGLQGTVGDGDDLHARLSQKAGHVPVARVAARADDADADGLVCHVRSPRSARPHPARPIGRTSGRERGGPYV